MDNSRMVMNFAESLNDINNKQDIRIYYADQAAMIKEDIYNMVVILLTMCVNSEMTVAFREDDHISVEEYPGWLNEIYAEILEIYNNLNLNIIAVLEISEEEKETFLEYLNNMVVCLLSGIKYIEKREGDSWHLCDAHNEWNTRYRREERIRDYMKSLISKEGKFTKFTIKKHIEIPYMYVLAWDLPNLFRMFNESDGRQISKDDTSYLSNLRRNTSIALRHISDNLLDILVHGGQTDRDRYEDSAANEAFLTAELVSYKNLLPTIAFEDEVDYGNDLHDSGAWLKARKNHKLPLIKKEVLRRKPLIPMESDRKIYEPVKSMEMMIGLMQEENKTKDYLESDIVFLKDYIVEICEKILDWLWKDNTEFTRIEKDKAEQYLISVIKAAGNVPRENSIENRDDHIRKLLHILAIEWDREQLDYVKVDDNDPESYVTYAYFSVLKLTRNWNEHKRFNDVSLSFVVFVFMISIRYLVDINKLDVERHREYLFLEAKLFQFFGEEKIDYENFDIKKLSDEYEAMYNFVNDFAFENGNKKWAPYFPDKGVEDPHQVLNTAGYTDSQIKDKMSENEIYLSFWLSIHFGKKENSTQKMEHTKDLNLIELLEHTFQYQKKSFLLK